MEVRQRMKLTGTNSSIGLIVLIRQCSSLSRRQWRFVSIPASRTDVICRPGGSSEVAAPDPIPNSAVKRLSAYDTSSQDAGKSVAARSANHIPLPSHPIQALARSKPAGAFCVRTPTRNAPAIPGISARRTRADGQGTRRRSRQGSPKRPPSVPRRPNQAAASAAHTATPSKQRCQPDFELNAPRNPHTSKHATVRGRKNLRKTHPQKPKPAMPRLIQTSVNTSHHSPAK